MYQDRRLGLARQLVCREAWCPNCPDDSGWQPSTTRGTGDYINFGGNEIEIPSWIPGIVSQIFGAFGASSTPIQQPAQIQPKQASMDYSGLMLPVALLTAGLIAAVAVSKALK